MDENKFNQLVKKLEQLKEPYKISSFDSDVIEHTYNTSHNNVNIQIKLSEYTTHSSYDVVFSDKNNKDLFSLSFFELNHFNDPTRFATNEDEDYKYYKYSGLSIDNIEVKDSELVNTLLQKVDFDGFLQKEIIQAQQKIDATKHSEELLQKQREQQFIEKQQQLTSELINKIGVSSDSKISMQDIIKKIDALNNSTAFFYFFDNKNFDSDIVDPINEYSHQSQFGNFIVKHKVVDFLHYEKKTHVIDFIDTSKDIDVSIEVSHRPAFKYHQTEDRTYQVNINNERIIDTDLTDKIIQSLGVNRYLDKSLQEISLYEQAKEVNSTITQFINKKITESKADEILKILDNSSEPVILFDLSKMPINISGAKIWLNKENKLHREDGPAVENYQGREFWFKDGKPYIPEGRQEYFYSKDSARIYENGVLVAYPNNTVIPPSLEKEPVEQAPVVNKEKSLSLMQLMKKKLFSSNRSEHKNTME